MKWTRLSIVLLLFHAGAHAGQLNDTGIGLDQCVRPLQGYLGTNDYTAFNVFEQFGPVQDAQFGRDPAQAAGALFKVGGGDGGFDFTRLCGNGDEEGTGTCPSGLTANDLGSGDAQWACTRDNVTGLTWELKTDDGGLRDKDWKYSWYNTDAASNGGSAGTQTPALNPAQCGSHLANCNTGEYAAALNALNAGAGLCGFTDWRMPHVPEMTNVAHFGETRIVGHVTPEFLPHLDVDYFPLIVYLVDVLHQYWSATPYAQDPDMAWPFGFHRGGFLVPTTKDSSWHVVLVRGEN